MPSDTIALLRQNDPHEKQVVISLEDENDDTSIAQALEQNPYVSRIDLILDQRGANWDHLFRVLNSRENLVHFTLVRLLGSLAREETVRPFIRAIQQNTSVRVLVLDRIIVPARDLCSFLDAAEQLTELTLNNCAIRGGEDARVITEDCSATPTSRL